MKKLILLPLIFLSISPLAFGQNSKREPKRLTPQQAAAFRESLNLSDTIQISAADSSILQRGVALKVYLAVGSNATLQDEILNRIIQWNDKEGKKQGTLVVVSQMTEADVLLIQMSKPYQSIVTLPPPTIGQQAGAPGSPRYPRELGFPPEPATPDTLITVYIAAQGSNEIKIIEKASYTDFSVGAKQVKDGKFLCDTFFNLLKNRK